MNNQQWTWIHWYIHKHPYVHIGTYTYIILHIILQTYIHYIHTYIHTLTIYMWILDCGTIKVPLCKLWHDHIAISTNCTDQDGITLRTV